MEQSFISVQQGWQCPICKRVYAPWVSGCDCSYSDNGTTLTPKIEWRDQITITPVNKTDISCTAHEAN